MTSPILQKKICLILPSFEPGGAERVMVLLAGEFANSGTDVCLVVLNGGGILRVSLSPLVRVIDLNATRVRNAILPLFKTLRHERPDSVLCTLGHLNLAVGLLAPFFPAMRFIAREANIPSLNTSSGLKGKLHTLLYRRIYPLFDRVICQSPDMLHDVRDYIGVPDNKLTLIPNPVDIESISVRSNFQSPFKHGSRVLLFVGRLESQKQPAHLAPILQKVLTHDPRVELHIIGDGSLRAQLEAEFAARDLSSHVHFWGIQKNPYHFMTHAACVVLTSAYEGFPNVLLEAGACGTPVVAYHCPGVSTDLVKDSVNGWLVPPGNIDVFVDRISEALTTPPPRTEVRKHIEASFSLNTVAGQYRTALLE